MNARTPALPEARAMTMVSNPTFVLEAISGISGLTETTKPVMAEVTRAIRIPAILAFNAVRNKAISPRVVERDKATFGPDNGAMTSSYYNGYIIAEEAESGNYEGKKNRHDIDLGKFGRIYYIYV